MSQPECVARADVNSEILRVGGCAFARLCMLLVYMRITHVHLHGEIVRRLALQLPHFFDARRQRLIVPPTARGGFFSR